MPYYHGRVEYKPGSLNIGGHVFIEAPNEDVADSLSARYSRWMGGIPGKHTTRQIAFPGEGVYILTQDNAARLFAPSFPISHK